MKNLIGISVIMIFLFMCYPKNGMAQPTPDWIKGSRDNSLVLPGKYDGVGVADYKGDTVDPKTMQLAKDSSYILEKTKIQIKDPPLSFLEKNEPHFD